MATFFNALTPAHCDFIRRQHLFFTASAAAEGRINLSPKGVDTFRILTSSAVSYLDLTGSGNETAAHLLHDGRMTIMFCSFEEKPLILRLYGRGSVVHPHDAQWPDLIAQFTQVPGQRQIIRLEIESVQTSCGFGVPRCERMEPRPTLVEWAEKKGPDGIRDYWAKKNQTSIDGLPTNVLPQS